MNLYMDRPEVVILAGGFGTRLVPEIGKETPKSMALVDGIPLLEHQINLCKRYGLKNILILVHYLSPVIINYFGNGSNFGVKLNYHREEIPRGTAGAIYDVCHLLSDNFIVIYGDTFLDVNLRRFIEAKKVDCQVLTFCHPNSHPYDSDILQIDESNNVVDVFRPSKSSKKIYDNVVNAALYYINKTVFTDFVSPHGIIDIASQLFPDLINKGIKVKAYKSVEYIKDFGTPDRYKEVNTQVALGIPEMLSTRIKRRCVFLDRDGVINYEVGHLSRIEDFELIPGAASGIKKLNKAGYLAICVTNQPVIARGELTLEGLNKIHQKMQVELGKEGAYLDEIIFCPHHPDSGFYGEVKELKMECNCRKPAPGMIEESILKFDIDRKSSWMIGDSSRDIDAGKAANIKTILIRQNNYTKQKELKPNYIKNNLKDAVNLILTCKKI